MISTNGHPKRPDGGSSNEILDVLIVGAGFSGLYLLHELRRSGFSVQVVEAGSGLGGVWHRNRYPGVRVDSDYPVYAFSAPELWENWSWTERFPGGKELRGYFAHLDRIWDLARDVRFNTRISAARFDNASHEWRIGTVDGDILRARFLALGAGFASKPYIPRIPGMEDFKGLCIHSTAWPQGGVDVVKDKKVIVIGTGATGVQIVQEAAKVATSLTVMQRTPDLAIPMQQQRYTTEQQTRDKSWYSEYYARIRKNSCAFDFDFIPENAIDVDPAERKKTFERLWNAGGFPFWIGNYQDVLKNEQSNRMAYDFWRERVRERLRKPKMREILAPTEPLHPFGTKRVSLEQDYFDVFNFDHVDVVNLRESPITHIAPNGVATKDKLYAADIIALATGFDSWTGGLTSIDIRGPEGRSIGEHWATGVQTYLGLTSSGFPNMFIMYGPQTPGVFTNGPTIIELQGDWITTLLKSLREHGHTRIEATPQAETDWSALIESLAAQTLLPRADSWYIGANIPGKPRKYLVYPNGQIEYMHHCNQALDSFRGFRVQ